LIVLGRIVLLARGRWRGEDAEQGRAGLRAHLIWAPVALILIPALLYLATYFPFFASGYGIADFFDLQQAMFDYHRTYRASLDDASRWWEWPLARQPVWYGSTDYDSGRVANIYANGNPFLYWAFVPAMIWFTVRSWRQGNPLLPVLAIGFFGQWLPWALVPRPAFVYHLLPAAPFGCLAVAAAVVQLCQGKSGWRRTLAIEYVVLVAAAFVFFFPLYAYLPLSEHALALRMWFARWR
ncbi:MAG: phospholipid carrier-dependent glycosyltransferase, partial [Chloroflexia bacterium]|nr:phospholipid carrier-dependent glycosyltransferase [Chloroflexia bacterium]